MIFTTNCPICEREISFDIALQEPQPRIEQFRQIARGPVWDGNVIGKAQRDALEKEGLVERAQGWNFLTRKGVEVGVALGVLRA